MKLAVLLSFALVATEVAALESSSTSQAPAPPAVEASPAELLCRTDVATGSRVRKREHCLTAEQWKAADRRNYAPQIHRGLGPRR